MESVFWICSVLVYIAGAEGDASHSRSTVSVSAPHKHYYCPVGATVKMECDQRGAALHPTDVLKHSWLYTAHSSEHCSGHEGPRHTTIGSHPHVKPTLPPGLHFGAAEHNFWVRLQNVTLADQGRYCCLLLDFQVAHGHATVMQRTHSSIILHVTPWKNGSQECTVWDNLPPESSVPVVLAVTACILALLSLPLILMLVYKQRQSTQSSRRAQELVRMDSEANGHENPVFLGDSPQVKTRTVSQIMTRQSSETGRHLLSEAGTPLSPPAHGNVFFPIEDDILESPDILQV